MKIKYKNFTIEQDRSCYVLTEYKKTVKGDNPGEEYISDQIYPATLESALKKMCYRIKANKTEEIELKDYIKELKIINDKFILDIKSLIK